LCANDPYFLHGVWTITKKQWFSLRKLPCDWDVFRQLPHARRCWSYRLTRWWTRKEYLEKGGKAQGVAHPSPPPPKKKIIITHIFPADLYACNWIFRIINICHVFCTRQSFLKQQQQKKTKIVFSFRSAAAAAAAKFLNCHCDICVKQLGRYKNAMKVLQSTFYSN
jgi:hypothetical protein